MIIFRHGVGYCNEAQIEPPGWYAFTSLMNGRGLQLAAREAEIERLDNIQL